MIFISMLVFILCKWRVNFRFPLSNALLHQLTQLILAAHLSSSCSMNTRTRGFPALPCAPPRTASLLRAQVINNNNTTGMNVLLSPLYIQVTPSCFNHTLLFVDTPHILHCVPLFRPQHHNTIGMIATLFPSLSLHSSPPLIIQHVHFNLA